MYISLRCLFANSVKTKHHSQSTAKTIKKCMKLTRLSNTDNKETSIVIVLAFMVVSLNGFGKLDLSACIADQIFA